MKIRYLLGAVALLCSLSACASVGDLVSAVGTATGLTVTRHDAIVVSDSINLLEVGDTAALSACTAANNFSGVCADSVQTAAHNVAVASRKAQNDLLAYANEHADLPAGPGGVYELAVASVADLKAAIISLGAVPPKVPTPATGS